MLMGSLMGGTWETLINQSSLILQELHQTIMFTILTRMLQASQLDCPLDMSSPGIHGQQGIHRQLAAISLIVNRNNIRSTVTLYIVPDGWD